MFTGIVQGQAEVTFIERRDDFMQLTVRLPSSRADNLQIGASIAINGTCLTIASFDSCDVRFDLIEETLRVTNLGDITVGDHVNFERAAKFGDEIGGHLLSGHVSSVATIDSIRKTPDNCEIWLKAPDHLSQYLLPKGFVSLNGCSLTIADVKGNLFNIFLIPETLNVTTFGSANVGDRINLEVDPQTQTIVDTVQRYLDQSSI